MVEVLTELLGIRNKFRAGKDFGLAVFELVGGTNIPTINALTVDVVPGVHKALVSLVAVRVGYKESGI